MGSFMLILFGAFTSIYTQACLMKQDPFPVQEGLEITYWTRYTVASFTADSL